MAESRGLLEVTREVIRARHLALRTEQAYLQWIRRYVAFHGRRHPRDLGAPALEAFALAGRQDAWHGCYGAGQTGGPEGPRALLVGFGGALRRSELVALDRSDKAARKTPGVVDPVAHGQGDESGYDLTNPNLGKELLADALGQLPYDVWLKYVCEHGGESSEVLSWCVDPEDPDVAPIDPQQAVDQALPLVSEVIGHLSDSPQKALEAARRAVGVLVHGSSEYQRGRGQAASMQHLAVRAWVIRKFNPHPKKPDESTANDDSIDCKGKLLSSINILRYGVNASFSK